MNPRIKLWIELILALLLALLFASEIAWSFWGVIATILCVMMWSIVFDKWKEL